MKLQMSLKSQETLKSKFLYTTSAHLFLIIRIISIIRGSPKKSNENDNNNNNNNNNNMHVFG